MFRKTVLIFGLVLASLLLAASAPIGGIPFPLSTISNAPTHYDEVNSAVTYNTYFMRTYFAVWQQNGADGISTSIYGRFVNYDGRLNGYPYMISPAAGVNVDPDVVYNHDNDQYLIVYSRDNAGIYGIIVGNAGTPVGTELTIASGGGGVDTYSSPAVAYSTGSGLYLVTWVHNHNGFQGIEARTITNVGGTLGTVWPVTGLLTSDPAKPDVAWSQYNNRFLVVWNKTATPFTDMDVYGREIQLGTTPGPVGTSVFTIFGGSDSETYPAVASIARTGGTGQFLVLCRTHASTSYYVDGQLLDETGTVVDNPFRLSTGTTNGVPALAGNSASQEYLASWPYDAGTLHARTISTAGVLGSEKSLTLHDNSSTAVAAGNGGDFLITASGWLQAGYPYDVFGLLWGNRIYLPFIKR